MTVGASALSLVERIVDSAPENVAVRDGALTITYGELSARADRLARALRGAGVKPGQLVGLCLPRSPGLVVGALAILRAGAAYVAVDPAYPDERMRWMLGDSGAVVVVTDRTTALRLASAAGVPHVVVSAGGELIEDPVKDDQSPLPGDPGPTELAYVVYTSGSTGRPKGAMIEHAGLLNLVEWHRSAFALGADDRCTQIASPGFDAAVWEIWPSLASGAAIHIVPEGLRRDPIGLRDWLVGEGITVTFLPTALAEGVIGLSWPEDAPLRYLLTGGDALGRRPPPGLSFTVVNNYGLSEATVVATSGLVVPDEERPPSIGRPISGVAVEVVDEKLIPVQPGHDGELLIGGVAVGRGYLGDPELTAERFVDGAGERWYRTGDRVRRRSNGELEFLGRLDDQLSIRGFRVEPGEIVAAMITHPDIEAGVVVGVESSGADRRLAAYIVASGEARPDDGDLDQFLGALLPEHMVPTSYVWLDALPVNQHGKVDRAALPDPAGPVEPGPIGRRPQTQIEAVTAEVMAGLLGLEEIGIDQNFFLLGGHSMLGGQLIVRLEDLFDVEVSLRYLFDHPTAAGIAVEIERQIADMKAGTAVRQ